MNLRYPLGMALKFISTLSCGSVAVLSSVLNNYGTSLAIPMYFVDAVLERSMMLETCLMQLCSTILSIVWFTWNLGFSQVGTKILMFYLQKIDRDIFYHNFSLKFHFDCRRMMLRTDIIISSDFFASFCVCVKFPFLTSLF